VRGSGTTIHTEGRKPFVAPTVVDQGELSDVTRMFSGGNNGKHKGQLKNKPNGKGKGRFGMLGVPGLAPDDFDVDTEEV
jgi:hypothetical protein